ncbi:MAG: SMC-Scp complex subunit ScpB [Candidatus Promineifilaceae bacterium]|nr:SMC-Scp complex subunit ScpB [Candidatus Promineifilaceae bacterium]
MIDSHAPPASNRLQLAAELESVLFVASGPVSINRLATTLQTTAREIEDLLSELQQHYAQAGIRLQRTGSLVQLTTAPENSAVVERFLGLEFSTRLSQAALEVLAIVAFMQPVTRPQVDEIRGVNSDSSLRTLLSQGLIEETGRMETPGRPILYATTPDFLQHFGLQSLVELPPLALDEEE